MSFYYDTQFYSNGMSVTYALVFEDLYFVFQEIVLWQKSRLLLLQVFQTSMWPWYVHVYQKRPCQKLQILLSVSGLSNV